MSDQISVNIETNNTNTTIDFRIFMANPGLENFLKSLGYDTSNIQIGEVIEFFQNKHV